MWLRFMEVMRCLLDTITSMNATGTHMNMTMNCRIDHVVVRYRDKHLNECRVLTL